MKVLVTGGAGFIGSHVCQALCARGDQVLAVDSFCDSYDPAIKRGNAEELGGLARFQLVEGDLVELDLAALVGGFAPDVVVHCAARAGVRSSIRHPELHLRDNVVATVRLVEAMVGQGCRALVFASSSSVYGTDAPLPFREDQDTDHPISPYAATKRACEILLHTWHHLHGLGVVHLRFFTVYGPRQRPDLAIHKFTRLLETGSTLELYGDGSSSRDYTHIEDILQGVLAAVDHLAAHPGTEETVNLGSTHRVTLRRLVALLEAATGKEARIAWRPAQPGDVSHTCASVEKARALFGYQPQVPLEQGLADFVSWWRGRFG